MKNLLTSGRKVAVWVLLAGAFPASAQSLGQPAGELWIGRPLELTIPARFQSEDSRDTCVRADVSYGETRLAPAQVRTVVVGENDQRRVRITSDLLVDEPLVVVTLHAGCGSTVTRSYTVLPELPSEAVLTRLTQPRPGLAIASAPAVRPAGSLAADSPSRPAGLRVAPAVARTGAGAPQLRTAKVAAPSPASAGWSRLRLEPLEADTRSLLRVSAHLSQPGDAALRAKAALLWQAIGADAQDRMRGGASLQQLEGELAQLRQSAGSTRADIASLRRHIDAVQPWYLSPRMVQGLALLVLAAAGGVALSAWRGRRAAALPRWYEPSDRVPLERQRADMPAATERTGEGVAAAQTATAHALARPPALEPHREEPPGAATRPAPSGVLRVETLAAILEEVEFLVSLGLHADAIDVLKGYLEDSASPAPAAFFELMRVCNLAEDPQAVEAVRRRYTRIHGVPAPTLAQVSAEGGLEQRPALAGRVTRAWGSVEVLSVIEQALFDAPAPDAPLPMQAAGDLIFLYDVAVLLVTDAPEARDEPLAPWAHAEHLGEAQAFAQAMGDDFGGHRFALDIDLSVVPTVLPETPAPDPRELAARARAEEESARQAAERAAREAEEAFNAAVAWERFPSSRH